MKRLIGALMLVFAWLKKAFRVVALFVASVAFVAPVSAFAEVGLALATEFQEVSSDMTSLGALWIFLAVTALGIAWIKATFF